MEPEYLISNKALKQIKKAQKKNGFGQGEQRIIHTDSDAPSDDPDAADLSEFTQASPNKTKVGDEFEESNKMTDSAKINESSTTGIVHP